MRGKKRPRGGTSSVKPLCVESLEARWLLSAAVTQTALRVPVPHAPSSPWIVSHGAADPDSRSAVRTLGPWPIRRL
jgi:hypothetical protein